MNSGTTSTELNDMLTNFVEYVDSFYGQNDPLYPLVKDGKPLSKVDIEVIPTDLTEDNVFGWCLENNNQFEIEIHHNLGYFDFVTTLIHELVHVDQSVRGLFDDQKRENEAYVLEKKLGKKFMLENEPCKVS